MYGSTRPYTAVPALRTGDSDERDDYEMNSYDNDAFFAAPIARRGTVLSRISEGTYESGSSGRTAIPPNPMSSQYPDSPRWNDTEEDDEIGGERETKPAPSTSYKRPWKHVEFPPGPRSPTDQSSESPALSVPPPAHITNTSSAAASRGSNRFSPLSAFFGGTKVSSAPPQSKPYIPSTNTPPRSNVNHFAHDPENNAPNSTPNAYHRRPANQLSPRSRSPSPETASRPRFPLSASTHIGTTPSPLRRRILSSSKENTPTQPSKTKYSLARSSDDDSDSEEGEDEEDEKRNKKPLDAPKFSSNGQQSSPMLESTTMHFGPAPRIQRRRNKGVKKIIPLTHGHFVVDLDVPSKLVLPEKGHDEMQTCRYTAVTCDPDEFDAKKYFLRQNLYGRETELAICITMYNEDEILLCRTLFGVMRNIQHLCTRKNSRTWGADAWKKVVVVIVADGRKNVHPRVLDCLAALGVYQSGRHMNNAVLGESVTAHLFEYTTSMALDPALHFQLMMPTQIIFCLKEKNKKKINSHRWFFNAFGPLLQPNVCVLLDVGTRPASKSIYRLWKTFDLNSNVGGACGEVAVYKGPWWKALINPLVAAQNFEYKMSNILDKPLESIMAYITVLPGAFSAYRYIALQNDRSGRGPLASYFKGEVQAGREHDIFTSNMYLAEDRILCFELVAKREHDWVLRYVKGAVGETDVPDNLPEFISQRRRWNNGSLFAAVYSLVHVGQILSSGHSLGRKIVLLFETAYNLLNLIVGWFGLGNYFLFFIILTSSLEAPGLHLKGIKYVNAIVQYAFGAVIMACFIISMGNKPKASKLKYKAAAMFFALLSAYMTAGAVYCMILIGQQSDSGLYSKMILSVIFTFGTWAAASILAFDPAHLVTSALQYLLLSPSYVIILNIYAFSQTNDVSWGTKQQTSDDNDLGVVSAQRNKNVVEVELQEDTTDVDTFYLESLYNLRTRKPVQRVGPLDLAAWKQQEATDYYANVRTNVLLVWVLTNGLLVLSVLSSGSSESTFTGTSNDGYRQRVYMTCILVFVAISSIVRFTGSTLYLIARVFFG